MAKKGKEVLYNPNSVPNKDILQRLNFLYQASTYLSGLENTDSVRKLASSSKLVQDEMAEGNASSVDTEKKERNRKQRVAANRKATARDLSRSYVKSMKIIGQKTNTRM